MSHALHSVLVCGLLAALCTFLLHLLRQARADLSDALGRLCPLLAHLKRNHP